MALKTYYIYMGNPEKTIYPVLATSLAHAKEIYARKMGTTGNNPYIRYKTKDIPTHRKNLPPLIDAKETYIKTPDIEQRRKDYVQKKEGRVKRFEDLADKRRREAEKAAAPKPAPRQHPQAKKAAYVAAYGKRHKAYERAEAAKHPFGLTPKQQREFVRAMEKPMNGEKIESEEEYWLRQPESEYEQTLAKSKATHKPRAPARKKPAPGKATPKRKPAVKKSPTTKRKSSIRSPSHTPAKKPAPKPTGKPRVLKASKIQTGKSDKKRDAARKAMAPGKRKSATGRVYYEYRKNRSDVRGRKT